MISLEISEVMYVKDLQLGLTDDKKIGLDNYGVALIYCEQYKQGREPIFVKSCRNVEEIRETPTYNNLLRRADQNERTVGFRNFSIWYITNLDEKIPDDKFPNNFSAKEKQLLEEAILYRDSYAREFNHKQYVPGIPDHDKSVDQLEIEDKISEYAKLINEYNNIHVVYISMLVRVGLIYYYNPILNGGVTRKHKINYETHKADVEFVLSELRKDGWPNRRQV